ncbi:MULTISPECIES: HEAT repeat domain-containing protein [unclassified Leucobacter]|uniref:HEAT repeat domain-containing protein n=1 Tax=unclassified Leucobacter TaxID=2621730 RepID=UPI00165E45A5|nr:MULTISPECIES: HEAT repeat domain-containing protein [unclassified Leucobacter]MBC9928558.1 HEAT repeat domain-containing protein [Leucobacter sp. cx-169]
MTTTHNGAAAARLHAALGAADSSDRLQAALTAGTYPEPEYLEVLVARCADESDFGVREMLTWSLTRQPADLVVPRLLLEVRAPATQARSQALHTLSKIGDPRGWAAISVALLQDPDDDVARSAWRAAVVLVPIDHAAWLAEQLTTQLDRGSREVQLSLGRAFSALGDAAVPALEQAGARGGAEIGVRVAAAIRLIRDPDEGYESALYEARRALEGWG